MRKWVREEKKKKRWTNELLLILPTLAPTSEEEEEGTVPCLVSCSVLFLSWRGSVSASYARHMRKKRAQTHTRLGPRSPSGRSLRAFFTADDEFMDASNRLCSSRLGVRPIGRRAADKLPFHSRRATGGRFVDDGTAKERSTVAG